MRWRTGFAWALAAGVSLAFLLLLAFQPGFTAGAQAGMSAPMVPAVWIESGPSAQLPQLQLDWQGLAPRAISLPLAPAGVCELGDARKNAATASPHYGPLHRRPPPIFS